MLGLDKSSKNGHFNLLEVSSNTTQDGLEGSKMHRAFKIFFASTLGAGVGAAIALSLHPYLWWIGLLIGGLTGYLSFEYKTVISALRRASIRSYLKNLARLRPSKSFYWKTLKAGAVCIVGATWALGIMCYAFSDEGHWKVALAWWIVSGLLAGAYWVLGGFLDRPEPGWGRDMNDLMFIFFFSAPVCCGTVVYGLVIALVLQVLIAVWEIGGEIIFGVIPWVVCDAIPAVARFVRDTTIFLILEIHSDVRLICGTDAAIGAGIGYFTGSVLIGALAGGLLGVLNYEIVTRRWLIPRGHIQSSNLTLEA